MIESNDLNEAKRWNDWNVWNGPILVKKERVIGCDPSTCKR